MNSQEQIRREWAAINQTLREFGVDAGVPWGTGHILPAGHAFVLFRIRRGRGVRIAAVERLLPEVTAALRRARGDDELMVRLREGTLVLEVPHPTPRPLTITQQDLTLEPNQLLVGRSWSGGGPRREIVTLDSAFGHVGVFAQTRGGKSTLLRTMLGSLALNTAPDACRLVLVDAKREDFEPLKDLPHVAHYAWRRDAMGQAIRWAHGEMVRRIERRSDTGPALVVAIDEVAKLLDDAPEVESELKQLAGQGAGTNVHLILATQHPTSKALGKGEGSLIKANLTLRLVGSVADSGAAQLATGRGGSGAHLLPVRAGAFLWVEGQRMTRIQTHLVDAGRNAAGGGAEHGRRWGGRLECGVADVRNGRNRYADGRAEACVQAGSMPGDKLARR